MLRGIKQGIGIFVGIFLSCAIFAFSVGTVKSWTTGETLSAADLNQTIQNLRTAIDSASQMFNLQVQASLGQTTGMGGILNQSGTSETDPVFTLSRGGTIKNVKVKIGTATNTCGSAATLMLRKNQTDTAITTTVANGASLSLTDLPGTVSFNAGDSLVWRVTAAAACTPTSIQFHVFFEY